MSQKKQAAKKAARAPVKKQRRAVVRVFKRQGRTVVRVVDADDIDRLLRASRAAHMRAQVARLNRQGDHLTALAEARDLRVQAHDTDPQHKAPAWEAERLDPKCLRHEDFMDFYARQLG